MAPNPSSPSLKSLCFIFAVLWCAVIALAVWAAVMAHAWPLRDSEVECAHD